MTSVHHVARLALAFSPRPWTFAETRRGEIDAHFSSIKARLPSVWNGRLLLLHDHAIEDGTFRGAYLETDFASFIAWRDWGFPDPAIRNCFAQAALRGSDGSFVLGVMSGHTINAGQIYFPSGSPDRGDIVGGAVDLDRSAGRELKEETGLTLRDVDPEPGWHVVPAGHRIAMMKTMQASEPAAAVRARILNHLAAQREPELSDIVIARGPQDLHAQMPDYVVAFLRHVWRV